MHLSIFPLCVSSVFILELLDYEFFVVNKYAENKYAENLFVCTVA